MKVTTTKKIILSAKNVEEIIKDYIERRYSIIVTDSHSNIIDDPDFESDMGGYLSPSKVFGGMTIRAEILEEE